MKKMASIFDILRSKAGQKAVVLTVLLCLVAGPVVQAAETAPFKNLLGSWKGSGTFSLQGWHQRADQLQCLLYRRRLAAGSGYFMR